MLVRKVIRKVTKVCDNKETWTKNSFEFVITDLFNTFYDDYIDFKHSIKNILNILNERNAKINNKINVTENIVLLEEQIRILKIENEKVQDERKSHLNIIEKLAEHQNSDIRKKTWNDCITVSSNKNRI